MKEQSQNSEQQNIKSSALKKSFIKKAYNLQEECVTSQELSRNDQQDNSSNDSISHGDCEIELQKVICENSFVTGKDGFDKNLNTVSGNDMNFGWNDFHALF